MSNLKKVVLALGANQGDCLFNIENAIKEIDSFASVLSKSQVYQTKPVGYLNQDDFLNCVILCQTNLSPEDLLKACKNLELKIGRVPTFKDGPRVIDIDIIFYESVKCETETLSIPHKSWDKRDFIITPLLDIYNSDDFWLDFCCDVAKILGNNHREFSPIPSNNEL